MRRSTSWASWETFRSEAHQTLALASEDLGAKLPTTVGWLRDNELLVETQIARRATRPGPETAAPLEKHIHAADSGWRGATALGRHRLGALR